MDDVFNPYYTFLGLDEELAAPNFYQLLRLRDGEADPAKVNAAADKATTRVRGHRPGEHIPEWSKLLDQIQAARACLLDPAQRAEYDRQIGSAPAESSAPASRPENPAPMAAPAMTFIPPSAGTFAYPPGAGPQPAPGPAYAPQPHSAYANPAPQPNSTFGQAPTGYYPSPAAQRYPQAGYGYPPQSPVPAWNPAQPAGDPMAPVAMPGPMSPVGYSWSTTPPAGPMLAPPVAPVNPNLFDPMAPVAFPLRSEPPAQMTEATPRIVGFAGAVANPSYADEAVPYAVPTGSPAMAVPVGQAVKAVGVAELDLPSKPASARPLAKRPPKVPLALAIGIGGSAFLLVVLIFAYAMSEGNGSNEQVAHNSHQGQVEEPITHHPVVPQPEPRPQPVRPKPVVPEPEKPDPEMTRPTPKPEPEPEKPIPEPVKPEPVKPEPVKPEPIKPAPPGKPTASELAELSRLMKEARTALGDFTFDEADLALAQAETLAKLPEHKSVVHRLKSVADMAKKFRRGIEQTMTKLEAGEEIKIGTGSIMIVVESSPEKLIIKRGGKNETYSLTDMPLGLAAHLGERSFSADDPNTRLLKGAYVFIDKRTDPVQMKKVKTWWEEAQLNGVDIRELLPVLTDKYEFAAPPE